MRKIQQRKSRNFSGAWPKTPGRLIGIGLIRLYQLTLSGFVGGHCRHLPTCSEYGYEAVARYGLWAGGFMSLFRFIRCGPFGTHGFDPVPRRLPASYSPLRPWRYWRLPAPNAPEAEGGPTAAPASEYRAACRANGKKDKRGDFRNNS